MSKTAHRLSCSVYWFQLVEAKICFSVVLLLLRDVVVLFVFITAALVLFLLLYFKTLVLKISLTAMSDGASLVYTSVKEMKNLDILYKYLVHRLYGFPFHSPAQVVERDAVFM